MILKNTSQYDTTVLRELAKFAARGIGHHNVELHIRNSNSNIRGRCFYRPFDIKVKVSSKKIRNLITLKLPGEMPKKTWSGVKRIGRLWPDGIPMEDWRDAILMVLAHEFRHVWQDRRERRTNRAGKGEYDAEKFAFLRLNKWRVATDRQPVLPVKQKNPFGGDECQLTNSTMAQEVVGVPIQA